MGRMTYVKALMCLLFPSAALVARRATPGCRGFEV